MSREWKPGDVAMVAYDGQPERLMLRAEVERVDGPRPCWIDHAYRIFADQNRVQSVRPLVVIDPESSDDAHRLLSGWFGHDRATISEVAKMTKVLRSLVAPQKPEEPTKWGAVVEDNTGAFWTLFAPEAGVWINYSEGKRHYHSIPAVRVVHEGVTA